MGGEVAHTDAWVGMVDGMVDGMSIVTVVVVVVHFSGEGIFERGGVARLKERHLPARARDSGHLHPIVFLGLRGQAGRQAGRCSEAFSRGTTSQKRKAK